MSKIINIAEDLSIKNIKRFHEQLIFDLENNEKVILNFSDLNRMDMAVAQVVMAFVKELKKRNINIKIKGLKENLKRQFLLCDIIRKKDDK